MFCFLCRDAFIELNLLELRDNNKLSNACHSLSDLIYVLIIKQALTRKSAVLMKQMHRCAVVSVLCFEVSLGCTNAYTSLWSAKLPQDVNHLIAHF